MSRADQDDILYFMVLASLMRVVPTGVAVSGRQVADTWQRDLRRVKNILEHMEADGLVRQEAAGYILTEEGTWTGVQFLRFLDVIKRFAYGPFSSDGW
jgi:Mn-dependent DtxR family transcriptional regulator